MRNRRPFLYLGLIFLGAIVLVSIRETKENAQQKNFQSSEKAAATMLEQTKKDSDIKTAESTIQDQFKKCFKRGKKLENIEDVLKTILQQQDYSPAVISEESYELTTSDNNNLVIQVIPQEEDKNQVRVFSISQSDGLPDRIKEFPESNAPPPIRLKGALSLGTMKSKSRSITQTSYDGSMLSIDTKNEKTVRLHLITKNFEFECKNQNCLCLTKE